jgi:hypothetical protein
MQRTRYGTLKNILTSSRGMCIILLNRFNADRFRGRRSSYREIALKQNSRIAVVGSVNMDLVLPVDRLPRAGETVAGGEMAFFPGGKGANQACAAARLGGAVSFIGQVGTDPFGAALVASLREAGVAIDHLGCAEGASGCASIYVLNGGENSIVISHGANATLTPELALSRLEALDRVDTVLVQLELSLETVEAVLQWARGRRATTILDPAQRRFPDAKPVRGRGTRRQAILGTPRLWRCRAGGCAPTRPRPICRRHQARRHGLPGCNQRVAYSHTRSSYGRGRFHRRGRRIQWRSRRRPRRRYVARKCRGVRQRCRRRFGDAQGSPNVASGPRRRGPVSEIGRIWLSYGGSDVRRE